MDQARVSNNRILQWCLRVRGYTASRTPKGLKILFYDCVSDYVSIKVYIHESDSQVFTCNGWPLSSTWHMCTLSARHCTAVHLLAILNTPCPTHGKIAENLDRGWYASLSTPHCRLIRTAFLWSPRHCSTMHSVAPFLLMWLNWVMGRQRPAQIVLVL